MSKASFQELKATNAALRASDASLKQSNSNQVATLEAAEAKIKELSPVSWHISHIYSLMSLSFISSAQRAEELACCPCVVISTILRHNATSESLRFVCTGDVWNRRCQCSGRCVLLDKLLLVPGSLLLWRSSDHETMFMMCLTLSTLLCAGPRGPTGPTGSLGQSSVTGDFRSCLDYAAAAGLGLAPHNPPPEKDLFLES